MHTLLARPQSRGKSVVSWGRVSAAPAHAGGRREKKKVAARRSEQGEATRTDAKLSTEDSTNDDCAPSLVDTTGDSGETLNVAFYAALYMRDSNAHTLRVVDHRERHASSNEFGCAATFHRQYPQFDVSRYLSENADLKHLDIVHQTMHYHTHGQKEGRAFPSFQGLKQGINICGHVRGCFGLAENPRSIYRGLAASVGIDVAVNEITCAWHKYNHAFEAPLTRENPHPVNIVCVNWNEQDWKTQLSPGYFEGKTNVCLWAFETERILPWVVDVMKEYDGIITISEYCARAIRRSAPGVTTPVWPVHVPVAAKIPLDVKRADAVQILNSELRLSIPADAFICLFAFDYFSSELRKNATGALTVFDEALGREENAYFIMKTINDSQRDRERVEAHIRSLRRPEKIIVVSEHLSSHLMSCLYKCSSVYMSLHRAEGQGLSLIHTLGAGIPTVTTNYSGNTDFCHSFNSLLVDWTHAHIPASDMNYGNYRDLCQWAEPDLGHARQLLRQVYDDYDSVVTRVMASRDYLKCKYNDERFGRQIYGLVARNMPRPPHGRIVFFVHIGTMDENIIHDLFVQSQRAATRHACTYYINVAEGRCNLEFVHKIWARSDYKVVSSPNAAKDSMGCAQNIVQCACAGDVSAQLYIVLQTKTDQAWREQLFRNVLDPEAIDSLLRYEHAAARSNQPLGIAATRGTVCPLYNDREKTVELANSVGVNVARCLEQYDDESGTIRMNDTVILRDEQEMDVQLYAQTNLDLARHSDPGELEAHYRTHGQREKRIAHRHIYERLTYSTYPIVAYGGVYAVGPKLMQHMCEHADSIQHFIIPKLASETGNVCDSEKTTYTHAFERLMSCVACELGHAVVELGERGVLLHVR